MTDVSALYKTRFEQTGLDRRDRVWKVGHEVADVVFTANFLEHLREKEECDLVQAAVRDVRKLGRKFIAMRPNIRYTYREYRDFYDHYLPFSERSLAEDLGIAGFRIEDSIERCVPYT
jgi:dolichol-phosphate mannosyltransferase